MRKLFFALALLSAATAFAQDSGKSYYVDDKNGRPGCDGLSKEHPFKSIQQAVNLAMPGDRVVVAPGVYLERVSMPRAGKPGSPITLVSSEGPEKTVISAANPAIRRGELKWKLEDEALQMYSIPLQQNAARVLYSGVDLFPYPTLQSLKTFVLPDGGPGIEHGCFYDDKAKLLYVRLHAGGKYGSQNPADHVMSVSPPHAGGSNGHHVWRPEEACLYMAPEGNVHIIVDGFTFETPGAAGVLASGSSVIRNCRFKGCRFGVFGRKMPQGVFIENCHYDQNYVFEDMLETIALHREDKAMMEKHRFFWWQRKFFVGSPYPYLKNYETGIPGGVGKNWHIRDNVIEEAFEGMSCWAIGASENAQVYGNVFKRLEDNAVETEDHAKNMRIYCNFCEDVFEPFSWQPLGGLPWSGPVFIYKNIVKSSPLLDGLWPTWKPGVFKLGAATSNWSHESMGGAKDPMKQSATRISKRFVMVDYPGFMVFNNTVVSPYSFLFTTPMPPTRDLVDFRFFNNIFVHSGFHSNPDWKGSLMEFYANADSDGAKDSSFRKIVAGENGIAANSPDEFGFADFKNGDFRLASNSPALWKGLLTMQEVDASADLGAIPSGESFKLAAGPGAGIPESELSAFQREVRYIPELVRTPGTRPGLWGVYSLEKPLLVSLRPGERKNDGSHSISLSFRLSGEQGIAQLASIDGFLSLSLEQSGENNILRLEVKGAKPANAAIPLPATPSHKWRQICIEWKDGGRLKATLDEIPCNGFEEMTMPAKSVERLLLTASIGKNPLLDASVD